MSEVETEIRAVFEQALEFARTHLGAERAMVAYEGFGLAHGLTPTTMTFSGEVSTTLLTSLLEEHEPMILVDAAEDPRTKDQTSAVLSALRSVLYLPVPNPGGQAGGLFYADHRGRAAAFTPEQLASAQSFLEETIVPQLFEFGPDAAGPDLTLEDLVQTRWL